MVRRWGLLRFGPAWMCAFDSEIAGAISAALRQFPAACPARGLVGRSRRRRMGRAKTDARAKIAICRYRRVPHQDCSGSAPAHCPFVQLSPACVECAPLSGLMRSPDIVPLMCVCAALGSWATRRLGRLLGSVTCKRRREQESMRRCML